MSVTTKCPKCGNASFERADRTSIDGINQGQICFIQCSSCGTAIGVMPKAAIRLIEKIANELNIKL